MTIPQQNRELPGGQPVDAAATIDRLKSQQDPALRGELQPQVGSRNAYTSAAKGGGDSRERIRIRAPSAHAFDRGPAGHGRAR